MYRWAKVLDNLHFSQNDLKSNRYILCIMRADCKSFLKLESALFQSWCIWWTNMRRSWGKERIWSAHDESIGTSHLNFPIYYHYDIVYRVKKHLDEECIWMKYGVLALWYKIYSVICFICNCISNIDHAWINISIRSLKLFFNTMNLFIPHEWLRINLWVFFERTLLVCFKFDWWIDI